MRNLLFSPVFLYVSSVILFISVVVLNPQAGQEEISINWNNPADQLFVFLTAFVLILIYPYSFTNLLGKKLKIWFGLILQTWIGFMFGYAYGGMGKIVGPLIGLAVGIFSFVYWSRKVRTKKGEQEFNKQRETTFSIYALYLIGSIIVGLIIFLFSIFK